MTELMEDIPEEMLAEVLENQERKSRAGRRWIKAAVAASVFLAGGGLVYAAASRPELFQRYMQGDNAGLLDDLTVDRTGGKGVYESETADYRMKVEEILKDQLFSKILVSVEPLNEKSGQVIENGSAFPVVNPAGNYQITAEKELRDGKRYYLIEMPSDEDTCSILFHPLLAGTDANETWMKAHKEEVLTLEFSVQPKAGEVIAISPGSVGEGAEYHSLTLSFMGIKGEASVKRKGDFPIPRVTAVMADGSQICLVEGNMGTQGKEEKLLCGSESCGGGFTGEGNHKQGSMKYEKIYEDFLDLRSVEKVFVNGVESWSR